MASAERGEGRKAPGSRSGRRRRFPWGNAPPRRRLEEVTAALPQKREAARRGVETVLNQAGRMLFEPGSPGADYLAALAAQAEAREFVEQPARMGRYEVFIELEKRLQERGVDVEKLFAEGAGFDGLVGAILATQGGVKEGGDRGPAAGAPAGVVSPDTGTQKGPSRLPGASAGKVPGGQPNAAARGASPAAGPARTPVRIKPPGRALPPGAERVATPAGKGGRLVGGSAVIRSPRRGTGKAGAGTASAVVLEMVSFCYGGADRQVVRYGTPDGKTTEIAVEGDRIQAGKAGPGGAVDPSSVSARNAFILGRPGEFPKAENRLFFEGRDHPWRAETYGGLLLDVPLKSGG